MSRMRIAALVVLSAVGWAVGAGCSGSTSTVERVRPAVIAPGSLLVAEGRGLDRITAGMLGDEPLSSVTVVNDAIITATAPPTVADGVHTLILRGIDGGTLKLKVTVRAAAADPLRAAATAEAAADTDPPAAATTPAPPTPPSPPPSSSPSLAPIVAAPPLAVQSGSVRTASNDRDDKEKTKDKETERPKPAPPPGGNGRGAKRGR